MIKSVGLIFSALLSRLVLSRDEPRTGITESLRLRGSMASGERESRATSPTACVQRTAISQVIPSPPFSVKPRTRWDVAGTTGSSGTTDGIPRDPPREVSERNDGRVTSIAGQKLNVPRSELRLEM